MTSSADLQFDNMVVDVKLAKEYMKKNNFEFHSIGFEDNGETVCDQANNKIYFGQHLGCLPNTSISAEVGTKSCPIQLDQLVEKIGNNLDLFCQLEFLIRKIPIETTQRELEMIVKYLRYHGFMSRTILGDPKRIAMDDDSSLIDLAYVAVLAPAVVTVSVNTTVVCHLFTELCRDSGIGVALRISRNGPNDSMVNCFKRSKVLEGGCVGVVTAQCDVESAVHVFLSAPQGVLWGLRRILVQESACERFKRELAWKTRNASQAHVDPALKSLCTDLYVHEGKVFLGEYVGGEVHPRSVVLIEAFRTVKELLTLIEGYRPFCVSLWSHGVAESNEIAFRTTAPMVWVNRYGNVGDHPQVSLAYYSHINFCDFEGNPELDNVREVRKTWTVLPLSERRKKVMAVLEELPANDVNAYYKQCIVSTQKDHGNFTHVGSNELVVGVCKPRDVYAINCTSSSFEAGEILRLLVLGSGFFISHAIDDDFKICGTALQRAGLPIVLSGKRNSSEYVPLTQYTRVIHTGIGTIFAN